ncbi:MAG: aminodeoxychorismate/anthranilate synthase component II [Bernardetiaceae bacterium]|nr:aminodeoxychorismate/anthranilate synthase component II [Bernardetiaceae bacterium]
MKVLVLDNYDSFVYNLVHMLEEEGISPTVRRNDEIALAEVAQYDKILLSPGPGLPSEAGVMSELIRYYAPQKSILGVCLGHQAIAEAFGGKLHNLAEVLHGISSENEIVQKDEPIFRNVPQRFRIGHYHSWVVDAQAPLEEFHITSRDAAGNIMSMRHKKYDVCGVQFHPESVLTEHGKTMIMNWLNA